MTHSRTSLAALFALVLFAILADGAVLYAQKSITLSPGNTAVDGTRIRTGKESFKVVSLKNGAADDYATLERETTPIKVKGRPALRIVRHYVGLLGRNDDTTVVDLKTLSPIYVRSHSALGDVALSTAGAKVTGSFRTSKDGVVQVHATLPEPAFDLNLQEQIIAALPLKTGYTARIPFYADDGSAEIVWYAIKVDAVKVVGGVGAWHVIATGEEGSLEYTIAKTTHANLETRYTMNEKLLSMKPVKR